MADEKLVTVTLPTGTRITVDAEQAKRYQPAKSEKQPASRSRNTTKK